MAGSFLIVPYARTTDGTTSVLVARVSFIQTWVNGVKTPGRIPGHAGQWVLIGAKTPEDRSAVPTAYKLFQTRTGINLADPVVAGRYGLAEPVTVNLQDANYDPFTVIYIAGSTIGLDALAADINRNIGASQLIDGVYTTTEAVRTAEAHNRLGPVLAPPGGWPAFIVRNYYGGQEPGPLNTDVVTLANRIARRSQQPAAQYELALNAMPAGVQDGTLQRLEASNAQPLSGVDDSYVATYDPHGRVMVRAVTVPPGAAAGVVWTGGQADDDGRAVSLARITKPDEPPLEVSATLGGSTRSLKLYVLPKLTLSARMA